MTGKTHQPKVVDPV